MDSGLVLSSSCAEFRLHQVMEELHLHSTKPLLTEELVNPHNRRNSYHSILLGCLPTHNCSTLRSKLSVVGKLYVRIVGVVPEDVEELRRDDVATDRLGDSFFVQDGASQRFLVVGEAAESRARREGPGRHAGRRERAYRRERKVGGSVSDRTSTCP